jgi:hypothetical protein
MSRTFRRKGGRSNGRIDEGWYTSDLVRHENSWCWTRIPYPKDSKEFKKGYAKYHGDHGTHNCKEPGPSWFRNLTNTRPLRQQGRQEIHKWMRDEEYEPLIDAMGYLEYWT